MKLKQQHYRNQKWKDYSTTIDFNSTKAQLVLAFGAIELITDDSLIAYIKSTYPNANIVYSSTSGEIANNKVYDNTIILTAIEFDNTKTKCCETNIQQHKGATEAGAYLINQLNNESLKAIFVFCDGNSVNGSELVDGFNSYNHNNVVISGGLAGDAARFEKPYVGLNTKPSSGKIIAVGLYGSSISIGQASLGGWEEFGHERTITRSNKNVLYEIDGRNALDLYKEYLGPYTSKLPGSALLFPISLKNEETESKVVRTILSIDEKNNSMTFAGNMPEGSKIRLMRSNFDKLVQASSSAAANSIVISNNEIPELAILVSCIGRKLVLQDRIDEEVQAARLVFGENTMLTGYYSYGEISPFNREVKCELHNQTMTITTLKEK